MTKTDRLIDSAPYGTLSHKVQDMRVKTEIDPQALRLLASKLLLLRDEAERLPGAAVVWGHLVDAIDAAYSRAIMEEDKQKKIL